MTKDYMKDRLLNQRIIIRCLLFLCLVIAPFELFSQSISVNSFKMLEFDLTANTTGSMERDQNGEVAALIKVVTPERDFSFDGGSLGIVSTRQNTGEIWVYVPRGARKLTIKHQNYGVLRDYYYPIKIEGGKTYEMLIDIGIGRYATITTDFAKSDVYVDGEYCGESPVRKYLNYGRHTIRASKDRYEGETTATITVGEEKMRMIHVNMHDMSRYYGDVLVTVDNNADIYYSGNLVGTGTWKTQLHEGSYTIETRKANSEPASTSFTVVAQRQNNIKANAPIPHKGWLSIYTRPRNVKAICNGSWVFNLEDIQTSLPVGTYQMEFSRKGYETEYREYTVRRYEVTCDTVTLQRVTYVKPIAFYFGGAFSVRALSGVSGILGAVYHRHDLQASYTFGLTESDVIYWDGDINNGTKYAMNSFSLKYGYQFPLMRQLAITPQVGYSYHSLLAKEAQKGNTIYGDGATSQSFSIGAKLIFVPMQHVCLFVAPEYMLGISKDDYFTKISNSTNVSASGFAVHGGLLVNF